MVAIVTVVCCVEVGVGGGVLQLEAAAVTSRWWRSHGEAAGPSEGRAVQLGAEHVAPR